MQTWMKLTIPAAPDNLDTLSTRLVALGFDSFQTEDERDLQDMRPYWDMADDALIEHYRGACRLIVYLPAGPDSADSLALLRAEFGNVTRTDMQEEDWAEAWKKYYAPLPVGKTLLIQPSWLRLENPENRAVFWNNPGMSFGTGLHASTGLCLELLEAGPVGGARVLDIGCGSGILALCALALGAENAVGVDIDPLAAGISCENAKKNALEDKFRAFAGDFIKDSRLRKDVKAASPEGYDLIFSNIVADVIIALAPFVREYMTPGALWRMSGIISPRLGDVLEALEAHGFSVKTVLSRDGWEAVEAL